MKRLLIISPFFPPVNAADMHRVRQSLSYYIENGWEAEVVVVNPELVDSSFDELLLKSIPSNITIHKVSAFKNSVTKWFGLGSIAYRSMYFYWRFVNALLKNSKYDLIFFSTTAFQICVLGRVWKSKFKIPYIIDMQDPWRSDHYLALPQNQRPPKFWISYLLDTLLEKFAMRKVDGLMSVSNSYIIVLKERYPYLKDIPTMIIPFAANKLDIEIAKECTNGHTQFKNSGNTINVVYAGRGGKDMEKANAIFLKAIKSGLSLHSEFSKLRLYYFGTSYDKSINAKKTIYPIAQNLGLEDIVTEITQRVPYFETLKILSEADILFVPGSDNIGYTASKIYAYAWLNKPLITLFHSSSSVNDFMRDCNAGLALQFDLEDEESLIQRIVNYISQNLNNKSGSTINWDSFEKYTAKFQVKKQVELFNNVVHSGRK